MADLESRVAAAREAVSPSWSKEREFAVRAALDQRVHSRGRQRAALGAAAALLLIAACFVLWARVRPSRHDGPAGSQPVHAAAITPQAELLRLDDGSTVVARSGDARATPIEVGPGAVTVRLTSGTAVFSVTPNQGRIFRVQARDVTVTVVGTVFSVALEQREVRVGVERGLVRVSWPGGERMLGVGEEEVVPDAAERAQETPPAGPSGAPPEARAPRAATRQARAEPSWRALAQEGEYASALSRMQAEGPTSVRDDAGDLLLAADVARLGGHPEKAISLLDRVVTGHPDDSRAPLAAFTLGRTLLDQLGRPREAAQAFAAALRLDPRGAMAQDALAREVESWSRAGEPGLARDRAEEYVARYPSGRRLEAVKRLGGLY